MDSTKYCDDYMEKLDKEGMTLRKFVSELNGLIYLQGDFIVSFGYNNNESYYVPGKIESLQDFRRKLTYYDGFKQPEKLKF